MPAKRNKPLALFHKKLHDWYGQHGRKDLPWRTTDDAYAIYISEIMLQQTQVSTVLARFYYPFLRQFPTLKALANASQKEVLTAWQGLGYYNRAANLHKAANVILSNAKDLQRVKGDSSATPQNDTITLPTTIDALHALPGIGKNTAHAIAAFAYRQPVPVMEANLKRVLSRIFALKTASDNTLWDKAHQLLDARNPFDYNQAMMDIGALVCTKRRPRCEDCPASTICQGKTNPDAYPAAKNKKDKPTRHRHIIVRRNRHNRFYATARTSRFLHGLYQFIEQDTKPKNATALGHVIQQYSHFTLKADIWVEPATQNGAQWYSLQQLHSLPMSAAEKKILALLA